MVHNYLHNMEKTTEWCLVEFTSGGGWMPDAGSGDMKHSCRGGCAQRSKDQSGEPAYSYKSLRESEYQSEHE